MGKAGHGTGFGWSQVPNGHACNENAENGYDPRQPRLPRRLNDVGNRLDQNTTGIAHDLFNLEPQISHGLPTVPGLLLKAAAQEFLAGCPEVPHGPAPD